MINAVDIATKNFCSNIIGLEVKEAKYIGNKLYGAAIGFYENSKESQWYLFFKKDTLNEFSKALLFEDNLNEDDLDDLVKEVANMIIGSAKVTLENNNKDVEYKIGVPDFLGHVDKPAALKLEEILLYKMKNRTFMLGRRNEN
jgi:chemotaxis protein CheY-P-specific phosphatase CheC